MSTRPSIVLIGPSGSGKSTVAPILARLLDRRPLDLDDLRQRYYPGREYDEAHADRLFTAGDLHGLTAYWKPFELHSVERVMTEFGRGHVIAFGAGQSVYRDVSDLHRARAVLPWRGQSCSSSFQPTTPPRSRSSKSASESLPPKCWQRFWKHSMNSTGTTSGMRPAESWPPTWS